MKCVAIAGLLGLVCSTMPASATHWIVDRAHSELGFSVKWSGEPFKATFKSWNANIDFDPKDIAQAHVDATIDLASELSDTSDNDQGLKGPEGFSVAQFPVAHFDAAQFVAKGGDSYVARGILNLHGVKRPLDLPFTLQISGNVAHVTARATVSRLDFGLGTGEFASSDPIAHEVEIDLNLTAKSAP